MPEVQTQTREQEIAEIRSIGKRHGLLKNFVDDLVERKVTRADANLAILNELARRSDESGGHINISDGRPYVTPVRGGMSNSSAELMVDALVARCGGVPQHREANPYRHCGTVELARDCLETAGVRTTDLSRAQIIERALHTTSDFPNLLMGTGNRLLRQAYQSYAGGLKRIAKPSTAFDFRAKQRLQLGEAPTLMQVNEAGEFTRGSMAEAKTSYGLGTYGRIFGITRQALVNDDLGAFSDLVPHLGRAASEFEAGFLCTLLTSNPVMSDGAALFQATHGNLATGAGSALSVASLSTARQAMRLQKGLDGKTPIDATPAYLVVPAALESLGEQLLGVIQPSKATDLNPFAGKLVLVVDPRLDAFSSATWYLSADPNLIDTIEYSYLDGENGPSIISKEGFEVDGVEMKVRLDYGAGVLDWRGLYKGVGA